MAARNVIIHVTGKVHGVFFRESTRKKAEELRLRGTVRNLEDGRVKIHASGDEHSIEELIAWCHKGPPAARVSSVTVEESDHPETNSFTIVR